MPKYRLPAPSEPRTGVRGHPVTGPSRDNPIPLLRPQGPDGLLFEGPEYRYTYVSTLLDDHEESNPLVIARRTSLDEMDIPCLVTLKQVTTPAGEERRSRALEEVRLATQLDHPAIARVYGLEEYQGEPYVVMEYHPGIFLQTALETALLQGRTLSPAHAVFIAAEMADAIHYAWNSQGEDGQPLRVVHRALHPMQIRLENGGRVKLLDFGMAYSQMEGRTRTLSRRLRADPTYAAPEVMRQEKPDGRADVYSLGLVLLEMVSGRYPLDPPDVAMPVGESPAVARYNARVRAGGASGGGLGGRERGGGGGGGCRGGERGGAGRPHPALRTGGRGAGGPGRPRAPQAHPPQGSTSPSRSPPPERRAAGSPTGRPSAHP